MTGVRPGGILSVDVEDYFQVEAFSDRVCRDEWPNYPHRVEANTLRVLDLLDECSVKGTFFILGWIAEHYPAIVREIAARGHELAVHSYWHRLIYKLSPQEFRVGWQQLRAAAERQRLHEQFVAMDTDKNGCLNATEYAHLMLVQQAGKSAPPMAMFDIQRNQCLDFKEYLNAVDFMLKQRKK